MLDSHSKTVPFIISFHTGDNDFSRRMGCLYEGVLISLGLKLGTIFRSEEEG